MPHKASSTASTETRKSRQIASDSLNHKPRVLGEYKTDMILCPVVYRFGKPNLKIGHVLRVLVAHILLQSRAFSHPYSTFLLDNNAHRPHRHARVLLTHLLSGSLTCCFL